MEIGPWRWDGKSDHDFYVQEGGWEEFTTVVYGKPAEPLSSKVVLTIGPIVDQPAGTGFSYVSTDNYVHTIDVVGTISFKVISQLIDCAI